MQRIILLSLMFLLWLPTTAQSQTEYPAGVYMSQKELLAKIPSQHYNLTIEPMANGINFRVRSPEKEIKRVVINRKIWAISDGETLYLNGIQIEFEPQYLKVVHEGKYLLYVGSLKASDASMIAFGGGLIGSAIAASSRWLYAWNPETRENFKINKPILEEWLEKTPWLLADYQNEHLPKDMDVLIRYASLRNEAYDDPEEQN
jgi:hypothetical protein